MGKGDISHIIVLIKWHLQKWVLYMQKAYWWYRICLKCWRPIDAKCLKTLMDLRRVVRFRQTVKLINSNCYYCIYAREDFKSTVALNHISESSSVWMIVNILCSEKYNYTSLFNISRQIQLASNFTSLVHANRHKKYWKKEYILNTGI